MTFAEFKEIIEERFPEVTAEQMEKFEKMDALYRDWNSKINVPRREWLPTPVFWPREFHGQRSLAGYSSWGCKESDMTE